MFKCLKDKMKLNNELSVGWWVGFGVEQSYSLMYLVEADKNSVRWGVWAVRWHKAGSFVRLVFVCWVCVPCKCA
jgi:hypothetical protein